MQLNFSNLITNSSLSMSRPIQLIDDKPYFATSLSFGERGGKTKTTWVIADSTFKEKYSEIELPGHQPFSSAPFQTSLLTLPRAGSTLSAEAYLGHVVNGEKFASAVETFNWTSSAIDRFVGFDGSFASQQDMSDFLACWVMSTYATDVFDTVGYPWPNGERGSGKSQCLKTIMAMSFMGITLTAGSSFASIRDEAALGATIGFDDCENLSKVDQNKRDLLLAGNTKGAGFTHKVPGSRDGSWETIHMDCFAPRAFTSIGLPDEVLGSRTIMIPLMRTSDAARTRLKPTSASDWTVSRQLIRDSIWLNVMAGLSHINRYKSDVNRSTEIAGRDFDIFQGPLCIAYWLEHSHGCVGLFPRMLKVMDAYHASKRNNLLPSQDECILLAINERLAEKRSDYITLSTAEITRFTQSVIDRMDITDASLAELDKQKIGMSLKRMGFTPHSSHGKARSWELSRKVMEARALSLGLNLPDIDTGHARPTTGTKGAMQHPWAPATPEEGWLAEEIKFDKKPETVRPW